MFSPPEKINIGSVCNGVITACIARMKNLTEDSGGVLIAKRYAMGAPLPAWQRESCWSLDQNVRLIESIWAGIPIGFYIINVQSEDKKGVPLPYSGILIDGQQRMLALEAYINDEYTVYGSYWSDVHIIDKREFMHTHFPFYETKIQDESQLRDLYNKLNFGGVTHREDQKA